jgi:hypothetical protein
MPETVATELAESHLVEGEMLGQTLIQHRLAAIAEREKLRRSGA